MDNKARELIQMLLEEGKRNDDVRRDLISEGYSTEGFDVVYNEIKDKLGIEESPQEKPIPTLDPMTEEARQYSEKAIETKQSRTWGNILKLTAGLVLLIFLILMFSGIGPRMWQNVFGEYVSSRETQNPVDLARESQLRTLQVAADVYQSKLLDYGGLCDSIGIDAEVYTCVENTEAYAIDAPLSNDRYFCVDSTGFGGIVDRPHGGRTVCSQ